MSRRQRFDDSSIRVSALTKEAVIKVRGKLERKDGKRRSMDTVIRELAEQELGRF